MNNICLGKKQKLVDSRTLQLGKYLSSKLPTPPTSFDASDNITNWGMMKNDTVGDCTVAAAGHLIMEWTRQGSAEFTPTDQQIISAYAAITGYNPATGAGDNGACELDVLKYWAKTGIAGHKIGAYAEVDPTNTAHVKDSVYLFNGAYVGLSLPLSAQSQVGKVWKTGKGAKYAQGSWGGHAVPIVDYDSKYVYCITWGQRQAMTWAFFHHYCDEAYAIISMDYIKGGKTIEGFDLASLQSDLGLIKAS